jgi:hypothetical protein
MAMTAYGAGRVRRPWRMLLERDVAEIERRLRLYRDNCPKRIAEDMGVHINTVSKVNLGLHPVQALSPRESNTIGAAKSQLAAPAPG